jgi:hypothetical protein
MAVGIALLRWNQYRSWTGARERDRHGDPRPLSLQLDLHLHSKGHLWLPPRLPDGAPGTACVRRVLAKRDGVSGYTLTSEVKESDLVEEGIRRAALSASGFSESVSGSRLSPRRRLADRPPPSTSKFAAQNHQGLERCRRHCSGAVLPEQCASITDPPAANRSEIANFSAVREGRHRQASAWRREPQRQERSDWRPAAFEA